MCPPPEPPHLSTPHPHLPRFPAPTAPAHTEQRDPGGGGPCRPPILRGHQIRPLRPAAETRSPGSQPLVPSPRRPGKRPEAGSAARHGWRPDSEAVDTSVRNSPGPVLHILCGWCAHSAQFTKGRRVRGSPALLRPPQFPNTPPPAVGDGRQDHPHQQLSSWPGRSQQGRRTQAPPKASCVTTRGAHPATDAAACPPTRHCWWEVRWGRTPVSPQDQPVLGRVRAAPGSCPHEFSRPLNITAGVLFPWGAGEASR